MYKVKKVNQDKITNYECYGGFQETPIRKNRERYLAGGRYVNDPEEVRILINGGKVLKRIVYDPKRSFAIVMNQINRM